MSFFVSVRKRTRGTTVFPAAILDPKMPQMGYSLELKSVGVDPAKSFCDWNLISIAEPKAVQNFSLRRF